MEKEKESKERIRKEYAQKGERSQKAFTFRLDNDLSAWLSQQSNKGRYINDLVRDDMEKKRGH